MTERTAAVSGTLRMASLRVGGVLGSAAKVSLAPVRVRGLFGRASSKCDACTLGDTNGDGIDDVFIHMPRLAEVCVLSGADSSMLVSIDRARPAADEPSER